MHHPQKNRIFVPQFTLCTNYDHIPDGKTATARRRTRDARFIWSRARPELGYHRMYDFVIHPEWDSVGCETLFVKQIFADYEQGYVVLELIGEWNDAVHNDVMEVKRRFADPLLAQGVDKFLLIADNLLNFHAGESDYYAEWAEEETEGVGSSSSTRGTMSCRI